MKTEEPEYCEACYYFRNAGCHRNPPVICWGSYFVRFPTIPKNDWCGEFKLKYPQKKTPADCGILMDDVV